MAGYYPVVAESQAWLLQNMQTSKAGSGAATFITRATLETHFTKKRIKTILGEVPYRLGNNDWKARQIFLHQLFIFSILVELGKPELIEAFRLIVDANLPLKQNAGFPHCVEYKDFVERQWKYCPKVFCEEMDEEFEEESVLPVLEREVLKDGVGSVIARVVIHEEFDKLESNETLHPNTYVFKTFRHGYRHLYQAELDAYTHIYGFGRSIASLTKLYGSFEQNGENTIILEYAACGSLERYLSETAPPRRKEDISKFWHRILDLSQALDRTHRAGVWHQDINLTNILICKQPNTGLHEIIPKLADYDRSTVSRFGRDHSQGETARDNFGSKEHGAPECFRSDPYFQTTQLQILQTADTWSLGTIWLVVAVWMKGGWRAVEDFRKRRLMEARLVPMEEDGCFHDGAKPLGCVHDEVTAMLRIGTEYYELIARFVCKDLIQHMLHHDSAQRLTSEKAVKEITAMWRKIASPRPEATHVVSAPDPLSGTTYAHSPASSLEPEDYDTAYEDLPAPRSSRTARSRTMNDILREESSLAPSSRRRRRESMTSFTSDTNRSPSPAPSVSRQDQPASSSTGCGGISESIGPRYDSRVVYDPVESVPTRTVNSREAFEAYNRRQDRPVTPDAPAPPYTPFSFEVTSPTSVAPESQVQSSNSPITSPESLPSVSVESANAWMQQRKSGGLEALPYSQHLDEQLKRDHVFILDTSYTLVRHFSQMRALLELLSYILESYDTNGMDLYIPNKPCPGHHSNNTLTPEQGYLNRTADQIKALAALARPRPGDATNIEQVLRPILQRYSDQLDRDAEFGQRTECMTIYILTDGVFTQDGNFEVPVFEVCRLLSQLNVARGQLGIQFITFGGDQEQLAQDKARLLEEAHREEFERQLRDGSIDPLFKLHLYDVMGGQFGIGDIVDSEFSEGNVWKMLLGAIDVRFDADAT